MIAGNKFNKITEFKLLAFKPHTPMFTVFELENVYSFLMRHVHGTAGAIQIAMPFIAILIAMELIKPGKPLDWRATFFNVWYTPVFLTISSILMGILWGLVPPSWTQGWIHLQHKSMPDVIVFFLLYVLMFDFTYYWFHRAQHTFAWLWKYHATHHADPNVSVFLNP